MVCKSCGSIPIKQRYLCDPCLKDYRYNTYRRWREKKYSATGGAGIIRQGKRWDKAEKRLLKDKIKLALTSGLHLTIRTKKIMEIFEVTRPFAHSILYELISEGKVAKVYKGVDTYYEVVK